MNRPFFTIVLPVYNSAKNITNTIQSILGQSFNNFELIVVNDGSTDNTLDIIRKQKDDRIHIITQTNSGVSVARNNGIKSAKGEYIIFVDGDDELLDDALKVLWGVAVANPDKRYIRYSGIRVGADGEKQHIRSFSPGRPVIDQIIKPNHKVNCFVWLLAIKNGTDLVYFNKNIKYLEDDIFYLENLSFRDDIIISIETELYRYNYNSQSKTKNISKTKDNINDIIMAGEAMMESCKIKKNDKKYIRANISNMVYWRLRAADGLIEKRQYAELVSYGVSMIKRHKMEPCCLTFKAFLRYFILKARIPVGILRIGQ